VGYAEYRRIHGNGFCGIRICNRLINKNMWWRERDSNPRPRHYERRFCKKALVISTTYRVAPVPNPSGQSTARSAMFIGGPQTMSAGLKQAHWKVVEHHTQKPNQPFCSTQTQMHSDHSLGRYARKDLKPTRSSSEKSFGCSQAAKCPPFSSLL
jgi:hypothetical protein